MQSHAKSIVTAIQSLPSRDELKFLEKQPVNKKLLQDTSLLLSSLINQILRVEQSQLSFKKIEEKLDSLLENAAIQHDLSKKETLPQIAQQQNEQTNKPKDIYGFSDSIQLNKDNFIPLLKTKPFAITPLDERILQAQNDGHNSIDFSHPYQIEITHCVSPLVVPNEIKKFRELDLPIMVDNVDALGEMVMRIQNELDTQETTEIALDLEHHHQYSYLGITCLIQLSTRTQDYIIDPFPLWKQLGEILNVVLANPRIVKVLHGADSDVVWLQRDFGLYIVNMFDTYQAARELQLQACSYQFLLQEYCRKFTDKTYQTADWTQRPLTDDMIKYAQMDTHYLLYIYDRMRVDLHNQAIKANLNGFTLIEQVFDKSKATTLKVYKKPIQDQDQSLQMILSKQDRRMDGKTQEIMVKLLEVREQLGIDYDENPRYFLPNGTLFKLVEAQPLNIKDLQYHLGGERRMCKLVRDNLWKFLKVFLEYNNDVKPIQIEQEQNLPEQNISSQQSQQQQQYYSVPEFKLTEVSTFVQGYESQFNVFIQNEVINKAVQEIEDQFQALSSFKLLNVFHQELGTEIFNSMKQSSQNIKQEQIAIEMPKAMVVGTQDFMELPKIDKEIQPKKEVVDIRLNNTLQNNYGTKLKKRHQQIEQVRVKKQSVQNRFQM